MGYLRRQLVTAALTANALRPIGGQYASIPAFFAGWLASELAPQLLAASAADTAAELTVRRGRTGTPTAPDCPAAGAAAAGLGYLIFNASRSATHVETTLRDGLGEDYLDALEEPPTGEDLKTSLRELARPFKLNQPDVEVIRDINYTAGGKRARLDIYRPKDVDLENAPVLVQVHGGGWTIGTKEQQGLLLMNRMAQRGWVCVAMNYRLAPKHPFPAQIVDVKKAIAWTRENIASYGGDPSYLVITGGSAGGHLAALAALTPGRAGVPARLRGRRHQRRRVRAVLRRLRPRRTDRREVRGPVCATASSAPGCSRRTRASTSTTSSRPRPLAHVSPDAPDFFVLHGANDSLVDVRQARAFVDGLKAESKATVTYAEFPGTQHAFEVFGSIRSHHVIKAVERWLLHHRARWVWRRARARRFLSTR